MFAKRSVGEPRAYVLSADGRMSLVMSELRVTVSVVVEVPRVVFFDTDKLPEKALVPPVLVELNVPAVAMLPVVCIEPAVVFTFPTPKPPVM